jgi:hypothetical protein
MKKNAKEVKSPGFYVPMDLAPGEYGSVVDYDKLKAGILDVIATDWGERCETKDYEDFPELDPINAVGDPDAGRCPVCLVYEKFDKFWEYLVPTP